MVRGRRVVWGRRVEAGCGEGQADAGRRYCGGALHPGLQLVDVLLGLLGARHVPGLLLGHPQV